jgi:hypothetical protein
MDYVLSLQRLLHTRFPEGQGKSSDGAVGEELGRICPAFGHLRGTKGDTKAPFAEQKLKLLSVCDASTWERIQQLRGTGGAQYLTRAASLRRKSIRHTMLSSSPWLPKTRGARPQRC